MEHEFEQHILLREVAQLPEHLRQDVNMGAILGMIAMEKVKRDEHDGCYICKQKAEDFRINLWEKS